MLQVTRFVDNRVLYLALQKSSIIPLLFKKPDFFHSGWGGGGYKQKKTFRHGEEKPPLLLEVTYPHVFIVVIKQFTTVQLYIMQLFDRSCYKQCQGCCSPPAPLGRATWYMFI